MAFAFHASAADERFIMITHAPDSDPWWNVMKNAVKEASEKMNVEVSYQNPASGDITDMARIVEQSVASNPDGIIVTIADYDVLKPTLLKAAKKGIPLITINSGTEQQSRELGALMHIGQPEYDAGFAAGKRALLAGVDRFLCVNHYITNPVSVDRCRGYADAINADLQKSMIDASEDPVRIEAKVQSYLRRHPQINGILALGPTSASPTIRVVEKMRLGGKVHFSTFDVSEDIAQNIDAGVIAFALDQQPYLQGFMAVTSMTLYVRYGLSPRNNMHTGPAFITKDNLKTIKQLSGTVR
ncbi:sugar ABC transporter substrate-binding protein [Lacimicrobium alkaliphilum]|uniref:Sugar ABC transporter substrate-binding protein n=2 Tax=Lacimicrobium alkaliphilum TaxID=1526571 RepID=A0A0U3B5F2_9ALTE|nr:sugar ABC transporter substrate-binding protein [Lacimicrobium alkaliphilum]